MSKIRVLRVPHLFWLVFPTLIVISVIATFFITRSYFSEAQLAANWKTYSDSRLPFKVKIPNDAQTRVVPAGFDNGMGFGKDGISRFDFFDKDFLIMVTPWKNDRNDLTLASLIQTRDFNGIKNVGMPICCKNGNEIVLPSGNKVLIEDSFLRKGGKFGMQAMILGKKYYYIISTGSIYSPNFTYKDEQMFIEFIDKFRVTE